ncbi:MAG: hypothetical protein ACFCVH_09790 [Alphaproteobacteria bacterium]
MRVFQTLGLAVVVTAFAVPAALACEGSRVSADSGQITIATGPEPVTPQTPVVILPSD